MIVLDVLYDASEQEALIGDLTFEQLSGEILKTKAWLLTRE